MINKLISFKTCFEKLLNRNKSLNKYLSKHLIKSQSIFLRQFSSNDETDLKSTITEAEDEPDFDEINVGNFSQLIANNEMKEKIETILSEYEYEKYTTLEVPKTLTIENMRDLLRAEDSTERIKFIKFFYSKQMNNNYSKMKRKEKSEQYWTEKHKIYAERSDKKIPKTGIFDGNGNIVYGLWHNSLFTKFKRSSMTKIYSNRLRTAAMFGQKIVIDLDFDEHMKIGECRQLAQQIQWCIRYNKIETKEPFDIQFANCNPKTSTMEAIPHHLQNYNSPTFMSPFHRQSYLDLFPKDNLVYITQTAKRTLKKYNNEDIYIIAGHVKSCRSPLAYTKAINEGIRVFRLPVEEHILWRRGAKTQLALNHFIAILHDIKMSGNWKKSIIDNIPESEQKKVEDIEYEDQLRDQRIKRRIKLENMMNKNKLYI